MNSKSIIMHNFKKLFSIVTPDYVLIFAILIATIFLNLQLLEGSNINFNMSGHDEYIAVREVYSILTPISYKHFFMAVISGDILYYGRIMFYADAFFAYLPFKIFGLSGMVFTIRMVHVLFLLSGIVILGNTFLKDWRYRFLFYSGTTLLYYTFYFYMVPKPDPIQLFLLSVFFFYFKKNNFNFGKYFILLGLAYGVKFNLVTFLPWIFIIPFLSYKKEFLFSVKPFFISIFYFLLGLIIAIPCLVLTPIKPIFLKSYYRSTFGYVKQYDDDLSLTILEWISKGWFGAYNGGFLFGIIMVALIAVLLYSGIKQYMTDGKIKSDMIIFISGLFLFIPVLVLTKRIWPHYLWTGYLLIILGMVTFIQNWQIMKPVKSITVIFLLLVIAGSLKSSFAQGNQLFSLQKNSIYFLNNGDLAYKYIRSKKDHFTAIQDLSVPYPFREMLKIAPYHPFASVLKDTVKQKFIWQGFISPAIVKQNNADFILTNKIDFNDSNYSSKTEKDLTLRHNNSLIRKELGKTIFFDTAFGNIKIYSVLKN